MMKHSIAWLVPALFLALPAQRVAAEVDFVKDIKPILENSCLKCHVGEKARAELRLDTKANLLKGPKSKKPVVVAGKAMESKIIKLITLPEDDEDRMPPEPEKMLTKDQTAKLRDWINEGLKWPDDVVLKSIGGSPDTVKDDPGQPITEQEKSAVAKLEKTGCLVIRLAQSTNLLRVDFSLRGKEVKDEDLLLLKDMAANLTELNLGGTTITDAGLVHLKPLKNLTRLQLHNTKITDAGLANLKEMAKLTSLNLYGSAGITDAGLAQLKDLKALKKLYLWQTKATESGAKKLAEAIPGLAIDRGYDATAEKPKDPPKEKEKK